jgi:spore coat protein U-like protein
MKLFRSVLIASAISLAAAVPAQAASTPPANFNVTATLTSKCEITVAPTDVAFTYTSFQAGAATATGGAFTVRCTTNLPYTFSLSATSGTVIGLAYTLSLSAAGGTGAGLTTSSYTINGSMVPGQSGICATTAVCTGTDAQTLTVTY